MAARPVVINGVLFDKAKGGGAKPMNCFIVGVEYDPTLSVGGGPIEPPPDIPVEPPLTIWPNPPEGVAPIPGHPIVLPGDPSWEGPDVPPPDQIPPQVEKPHPGWNWSAAKSQWYFLYVPGSGDAQPKKK